MRNKPLRRSSTFTLYEYFPYIRIDRMRISSVSTRKCYMTVFNTRRFNSLSGGSGWRLLLPICALNDNDKSSYGSDKMSTIMRLHRVTIRVKSMRQMHALFNNVDIHVLYFYIFIFF